MTRIAVVGAAGRMGRRLIELAVEDPEFQVTAAIEAPGHPRLGEPTAAPGVAIADVCEGDFDVMVEFALPAATARTLDMAVGSGRPVLIGTTGHSVAQLGAIRAAARSGGVLKPANTGVGVTLRVQVAGQVGGAWGGAGGGARR